jgi:nucleoside-diphosphate-sugar epimerase
MLTHLNDAPVAPRRVVVLGAGGFIGKALCLRLAADGIETLPLGSRTLDLAVAGAAEQLADQLHADDSVVMLSALTPDKGKGTGELLRNLAMAHHVRLALARAPVRHLVYVSSDAVYPLAAALVSEGSPAAPTDLYGSMHLSRELMLAGLDNLPLATLRPTLTYGPGDTHNAYGPNRFFRAARGEGRIALFGGGEETRDHVLVDDVARLIAEVLRRRSSGVLNVATGRSVSFAELATRIAAFGGGVQVVPSERRNAITHRHFDTTARIRAFPAFAFTPLERGLELMNAAETI